MFDLLNQWPLLSCTLQGQISIFSKGEEDSSPSPMGKNFDFFVDFLGGGGEVFRHLFWERFSPKAYSINYITTKSR